MRFLINNVWYWRARLDVQAITVSDDALELEVVNHGRASTTNASLEYHDVAGEVLWASPYFTVNSSNMTSVSFEVDDDVFETKGMWNLNYQKRVINASTWVNESVDGNLTVFIDDEDDRFLSGVGLFNPVAVILGIIGVGALFRNEEEAIEETLNHG